MSLFEAKIPFLHKVWVDDGTRDSHGNKTGHFADPVQKYAVQIYPANSTISRSDMVNPNVVARTETDIMLDVDSPEDFNKLDEIVLAGLTFKVQGDPEFGSWDMLPISGYSDLVPGSIHVKRTT